MYNKVVSSSWLLQISVLWAAMYKCLYEQKLLFLSDKYLEAEQQVHV